MNNTQISADMVRQKTYDDMVRKLKKPPHLCAVPRPTGFGKTCMATDLIKTGNYKKILYLYPAGVVRNAVLNRYYYDTDPETADLMKNLKSIKNVVMTTYLMLAKTPDDSPDLKGYDLIIFDECHRMAAFRTYPKAKALMRYNPNAHIIGLTATPNRSDGFDVIEKLFRGITVFPYTLHDAFQDGIYKAPHYCYVACDQKLNDKYVDTAFMAGEDIDDLKVKRVLKRKFMEIQKVTTMNEDVLKDTCEEVLSDTSYMKFICFFSTHSNLLKLSKQIKHWFREAYPDHTIQELEISSRKPDFAKNVDALEALSYRKNGIDLIYAVDMLNMGYHVDDISGILMYRTTASDIIFPQEFGRILSSGNNKEHIVFDIVDNLHRSACFTNPFRDRNTPGSHNIPGSERVSGIEPPDGIHIDPILPPPSKGPGSDNNGKGIKKGSGGKTSNGGKTVTNGSNGNENPPTEPWYNNVNTVYEDDIIFTAYTATYREMIAKLVAEPMQMRCKEAFEAHFKRWCKMNKVEYPISNKKLKEIYNLEKEDFVKYFEKKIKENKLNYPMRDAEKLLEIGRKRKDGLPMDVFAKWKNISVNQILDLLGVAENKFMGGLRPAHRP